MIRTPEGWSKKEEISLLYEILVRLKPRHKHQWNSELRAFRASGIFQEVGFHRFLTDRLDQDSKPIWGIDSIGVEFRYCFLQLIANNLAHQNCFSIVGDCDTKDTTGKSIEWSNRYLMLHIAGTPRILVRSIKTISASEPKR